MLCPGAGTPSTVLIEWPLPWRPPRTLWSPLLLPYRHRCPAGVPEALRAAWAPYVLRHHQWRHECIPEAQIALGTSGAIGARGAARLIIPPTSLLSPVANGDEKEQQIVYGYLCQRFKGVVSILDNNRILFGRAQDYLLTPPSRRLQDK